MEKKRWYLNPKFYLLIFLVSFTFGKILKNNLRHLWTLNSASIQASKSMNAFISQYEIYEVTLFTKKDSNLIKDLVIWKETQMTTQPVLIFFHPIRPTDRVSLILKSNLLDDGNYIHARLKGNGYGGNHQRNHIILTEDRFNKEAEIMLYRNRRDSLGLIKIREKI